MNIPWKKYIKHVWYEQARFPTWFESGGRDAQAKYTIINDNNIRVENKMITKDEKIQVSVGRAWIAGPRELHVSFFYPFYGIYYVFDWEEDDYSIVGTLDFKYLWILTKEQHASQDKIDELITKAKSKGFDIFNNNIIYNNHK